MALGGMLTATAVVIMCLGSLIPVNTYVCPVLCILITRVVLERCGRRIGWCYYIATAVLSLMLAPDRQAARVTSSSSRACSPPFAAKRSPRRISQR